VCISYHITGVYLPVAHLHGMYVCDMLLFRNMNTPLFLTIYCAFQVRGFEAFNISMHVSQKHVQKFLSTM